MMNIPLAERIRPQKLEDYISQQHLIGPNGSLTQQISKGIIPSLIFWGPPGTGKTTLAHKIAEDFKKAEFEESKLIEFIKIRLEESDNKVYKLLKRIQEFREENGLAMSSRNERLSPTERNLAAFIYKTLLEVKNKFSTESLSEITLWVNQVFESQPDFKLDYFEIADEATLLPVSEKESDKKYRGFIAIFIENIRLIDNISLN